MAVLGVASITPAFPSIMKYFKITPTQVALLITIFTLPGIFLTPVMGILADRLGRKAILIPSLFLFGIAGVACMFTRDWQTLLLLRFFQGVGAASLGTLNVTLIGDLYSGPQRTEAMGYNASVLSIGTASYPAIGGALAMGGWYYPFILPFLAIPIALFVIWGLKNPEPPKGQDLKTYLLQTWKNINRKNVWGLFIVNILVFVLLYGAYLSYTPQLLEERLSAVAWQIGLLMSGFSAVTALTSSQLKRISRWITVKNQLLISFILYFITMVVMAYANTWLVMLIPVVTFGIAHGMLIPGIQNLLVGLAPLKERAGFMSINSMVLRLGQTFGPVFIGLFYTLGGISVAFLAGAAVSIVMVVILFGMIKI